MLHSRAHRTAINRESLLQICVTVGISCYLAKPVTNVAGRWPSLFHNACVLIVVVGQGYFENIDGTHLPESTSTYRHIQKWCSSWSRTLGHLTLLTFPAMRVHAHHEPCMFVSMPPGELFLVSLCPQVTCRR